MLKWHAAGRLVIPLVLTGYVGWAYAETTDGAYDTAMYAVDNGADPYADQGTMPVSYGQTPSAYDYQTEAYQEPEAEPQQYESAPAPAPVQKTQAQYQREWELAQQQQNPQLANRQAQLRQQLQQQQLQQQQQRQAALQRQEQAQITQVRQQQEQARQRALQQQAAQQRQYTPQQRQQIAQMRALQQQQQNQLRRQQVAAQQQQQAQNPNAAQLYQQPASRAYEGGASYNRLPDSIAGILRRVGISEAGMSTYVRNVMGGPALVAANAERPSSPASTMKLVTSYAALGTLGPAYRWPTELYVTGPIIGGNLQGHVIIKGYGDPDFREDDLLVMLQQLRARGVRNIAGGVIVDRSYFQLPYEAPGAFDGNAGAAYNAQPDALLFNERGSCYEFRNLKGQIQRVCPLPRNSKVASDLNTNIFGGFWKLWVGALGGTLQGGFQQGQVMQGAQLLYRHQSKPLAEILKTVNKDSNNVMARQIMLSVGARQMGAPATPRKGAESIGRFLESRGLFFPELRIENGAGLSRIERISARHLGEMLVDAFHSPYRDALLESMAALGMEGTVKNRLKGSAARGYGRFKTGTLRNVRAIAGYIQSLDGQVYAVSILHNDPSAGSRVKSAHDKLIEWVFAARR